MTLTEYLKLKGMTQTEFGRLLNPPMTQMHISHIVNGRTRISLARALEIAEVTGGEVPPRVWLEIKDAPMDSPEVQRGDKRLVSDIQPSAKPVGTAPECGTLDPRHGERRDPDRRQRIDRRVGG